MQLSVPERREFVAEMVAENMSNVAIADVLGVDEGTIRNDKRALSENSDIAEQDARAGTKISDGDSENSEDDETWWDDGTPEPMPDTGWQPSEPKPHVAHNSGDNEWYTPTKSN